MALLSAARFGAAPTFFAVVVCAALAGAGCTEPVATPDDGPGCVVDADCASGLLCIDAKCVADPTPEGCTRNGDCDAGLVCRDNACVDAPVAGDCQGDADCDVVDRCDVVSCLPSATCAHAEPGIPCDDGCYGTCVGRDACTSDGDCDVVEHCSDDFGVCLPIGPCDGDSDCPADASCVTSASGEGTCTQNGACTVERDCPDTQHCEAQVCTQNDACDTDSACPSDQRCVEGLCTRRGDCSADDDCNFDEICDDGTCNVIGACTTVDDCPAAAAPGEGGIACLDGVCTRAPCGRDADCDNGLFCDGQETCNPRVGCADGPDPATPDLPGCATEVCDESRDTLLRTGHNDQCGDASPCTDDVCDVELGCVHPENDFQPDPGPAGDCERTVCEDGAIKVKDADDEVPADAGSSGDCARAVCQGGARVLVADDSETPADPGPITDCKRAICSNGSRVLVTNDAETPTQGPQNDCVREICQGGLVFVVDDNAEVPPQGPLTDCQKNVCSAGRSTAVADDTEQPLQGPSNDCKHQTCSGGVIVAANDDNEVPPQGVSNDCKREVCSGGVSTQVANNTETPPQRSTTDCTAQTCSGGAIVDVPAAETPPQRSPTDCTQQTCQNGAVVDAAANTETPPQRSSTDCTTQQCLNGAVVDAANNNETPPQGPTNDCKRETCSGGTVVSVGNTAETPPQNSTVDCKRETCSAQGTVVSVNNDSETPADVGCKDGVCSGGVPTTVQNNGNCSDAFSCTAGTCNVDGTCSQTPNNSLCPSCGAGNPAGVCAPQDSRRNATTGCFCPTKFTCGVDDGILVRKVLERFELFATPAGATGTTFNWDLVGTPAGVDPAAQLLGNPTRRDIVFFQATSPSALGVKDYKLRVTAQEPNAPPFTCDVSVEAQKIPDTLEVTLFMNDPLDVDVHLISGVGATFFDMPFVSGHEEPPDGTDDRNRDCFWENCKVCSISIPGQPTCTATSPRIVDFDMPTRDGAALTDDQDPQLDIDNQRGCFTAANGDLQCIPEKITVKTPGPKTSGQPDQLYRVYPYLWGNALATSPGLATTPSATEITLQIQCRGVITTIDRTLSSVTSTGTLAGTTAEERYGDPIFITVPFTGACTVN